MVILFACLWRRQLIVQITDPPTETSALIINQADNRAVEHDFLGTKDKFNEPVQEEDGDLKGEYKFPGKDDRTVVV